MPPFWILLHSYCPLVDELVNKIIDEDLGERYSKFHWIAVLNETKVYIWVQNYPFGYGEIADTKRRPSRSTIFKLRKYITEKEGTTEADNLDNTLRNILRDNPKKSLKLVSDD